MNELITASLDMAARMMDMGLRPYNPILAERTAPAPTRAAQTKQQKEGNNG